MQMNYESCAHTIEFRQPVPVSSSGHGRNRGPARPDRTSYQTPKNIHTQARFPHPHPHLCQHTVTYVHPHRHRRRPTSNVRTPVMCVENTRAQGAYTHTHIKVFSRTHTTIHLHTPTQTRSHTSGILQTRTYTYARALQPGLRGYPT
jgi:hypothetical protein